MCLWTLICISANLLFFDFELYSYGMVITKKNDQIKFEICGKTHHGFIVRNIFGIAIIHQQRFK